MEENNNNNVTNAEEKKISFSFSASMLFLLVPLAILATYVLFNIIMNFIDYSQAKSIVSAVFAIFFYSAALGWLGLSVVKFRTLNLEVVLSMVVAIIILL